MLVSVLHLRYNNRMDTAIVPPREVTETVEFSWQAPDRPFKKRGIRFYFNIALIAIVICLILLFFYQYILLAVVFSIIFVGLASATVPPKEVEYQVTNKGIKIGDAQFAYDQLKPFWQSEMLDHKVIIIPTLMKLPKQLIIMLDKEKSDAIIKALTAHIKEVSPPPLSWADRRAAQLVKLVNFGVK